MQLLTENEEAAIVFNHFTSFIAKAEICLQKEGLQKLAFLLKNLNPGNENGEDDLTMAAHNFIAKLKK